ncbi:MAG TPA: hypothetical protein VIR54_31955 [Vicinamibacterales bacterium]|jgi:hypothetical protein
MPTRKTRKERFKTALLRAGISQEKWRSTYHKVSRKHLIEALAERRVMGAELKAKIDRFIKDHAA